MPLMVNFPAGFDYPVIQALGVLEHDIDLDISQLTQDACFFVKACLPAMEGKDARYLLCKVWPSKSILVGLDVFSMGISGS